MFRGKNLFERLPERLDISKKSLQQDDNECLWSRAGVVPNIICNTDFDCPNCLFDSVMHGGGDPASGKILSKSGKFCTHRFYNTCHTWARVEAHGFVRIGIDDFGQNILGPISKIDLPARHEKIGCKSIRITARSTTIPLLPPVEGYVENINEHLLDNPQLTNKSPYEKGWLVLLRPTRLAENLENLFYGAEASKWFDLEIFKLAALITSELNCKGGEKLGMTLPDGSLPDFEILNKLPPSITKKVIEQCFLYCHTNDKFTY